MSGVALLRRALLLLGCVGALALAGCAHPISLTPNLGDVKGAPQAKIDKKVGLVVTESDRKVEAIGPGGGGDKVSFFPYRDLEAGLYFALGESFAGVTRLSGPTDPRIQSDGLHWIITPRVSTTSYSPSLLTWPPTIFTVSLDCQVVDSGGRPVTQLTVQGEGRAEFDEFKSDFSLSARRASEDALRKLMKAIAASPQLR